MSTVKPTILKIGGSVITEKDGELAPKTQVISRLVDEIARANVENLILIHGGGSFGHPYALRYSLKEGLKDDAQKIGFSETHHFMTVLNGLVMDALIWRKVPSMSLTPSSFIITENERIKEFDETAIRMLLEMDVTPVLFGDAVLDKKRGFAILSGDNIAAALATRFGAKQVIMGADVEGLFDANPKRVKDAKLLKRLTATELKSFLKKNSDLPFNDVTGGMIGKVKELLLAVEAGVPVTIVNANEPDNIYRVLKGEHAIGTVIEKG